MWWYKNSNSCKWTSIFKRRLDHYYHNIGLKEALTGFKLEMPRLNGKDGLNNTENPNIIKPGFVK